MQICRRKGHVKIYLEWCKALGIEPNSHMFQRSECRGGLFQSSLDSIVNREPKKPPFTTCGLLDYLVELIVCEDEVCLPAHPTPVLF
jgi:hypothetical protein